MTTNNRFNKTSTNIALTKTTNQISIGTSNVMTLNFAQPATSLTLAVPDLGTNGNIVLASSAITNPTILGSTFAAVLGDGTTNFIGTGVLTWIRVCNTVFFSANYDYTSKNGATGSAMQMTLPTSLPLPSSANIWGAYVSYDRAVSFTNTILCYIDSTSPARIQFFDSAAAGTISTLPASKFANNGQFIVRGSYNV